MIPQDLTFAFPQALFFLLVIPAIFIGAWLLYHYRRRVLQGLAHPSVLSETFLPRSSFIFWMKTFALAGVWALCVFALMQPHGNAHYPEEDVSLPKLRKMTEQTLRLKRRAHELIFLVDASASMLTTDTRPGISRLDYAKDIADQIVRRLDGESASLYAFTSAVTQMSPSTSDYLFVRLMLRQIHINEGEAAGTDLFEALASMRDRYLKTPGFKLKTLIILSDGGDTRIESVKNGAREEAIQTLLNLLGDPQALNLRVYTIGLGSLEGGTIPKLTYEGQPVKSALQKDIMRQLAKRGRGKFYNSNENSALSIAQDLSIALKQDKVVLDESTVLKALGAQEEKQKVYDAYYQIPLGLALLLLAFILLWPDAKRENA